MTSIAAAERAQLAALADRLGPGAPTLCEGWTVKDLIVHLLVREGSPASVGVAVPRLAGLLDRATERRAHGEFPDLVRALREGPPLLSPFRLPVVGAFANTAEFFVHHEDVRRAQPGWAPRTLPAAEEDALWRSLRLMGRGLVAGARVGVRVERTDTGDTATLKGGEPAVVLRGRPSELLLHAFGRRDEADVELSGDDEAVAALAGSRLGF